MLNAGGSVAVDGAVELPAGAAALLGAAVAPADAVETPIPETPGATPSTDAKGPF